MAYGFMARSLLPCSTAQPWRPSTPLAPPAKSCGFLKLLSRAIPFAGLSIRESCKSGHRSKSAARTVWGNLVLDLRGNNRERSMLLARGPDGDFHVLTQGGEEFHKTSDRDVTRAIPHEQRDLRLLHAENFGDLHLRQAAVFENRIDLQGELCLEQLLLGITKAKVCEYVSTSLGYSANLLVCFSCFGSHFSSASLYNPARLQLVAA